MEQQVDPRTQGTSYGPPQVRQPLTDQVAPIIDALDQMTPEQAHLANSVGTAVSRRSGFGEIMKAAQMGETPDSLRKQAQAAQAAEMAGQLASQSMELDDSQFDGLMKQLEGEIGQEDEVPQFQQTNPSQLEMAGGALGSILFPQFAFDAANAPFVARQRQDAINFQNSQIRAKSKAQQKQERIMLLRERMDRQTKKDMATLDARVKLGDQRAKDIKDAQLRILTANRPGEAKLALQQLANLDSALAQQMTELVEKIEAEAGAKYLAEMNKMKLQGEATAALTKQREFNLKKAEKFLPLEFAKLEDQAGIADIQRQIAESNLRMRPDVEKLMNLRVQMQGLKNHFYPQEVAYKAQMAEFYAELAAQNFDLNVQKFQQSGDEFSQTQAGLAKEQLRTAKNQALEAIEADRKNAMEVLEKEPDEAVKEQWRRYINTLTERHEALRKEMEALDFGGPPTVARGTLPGGVNPPQIDIALPPGDSGTGFSGQIGGGAPPGYVGGGGKRKVKSKGKAPPAAKSKAKGIPAGWKFN